MNAMVFRAARRRAAAVCVGVIGVAVALAPAAQAAVPASDYSIVPKPLDFGHVTVGGQKTLSFTITNTSPNLILAFAPAGTTGDFADGPFVAGSNPCAVSMFSEVQALAPGASCQLEEQFISAGSSGAKSGTAKIDVYSLPASTQPGTFLAQPSTAAATASAALKGVADPLRFTVDPDPVAFGHLTAGATETTVVTVTNNSDLRVEFAGGAIAPANSPFSYGSNPDLPCFATGEGGTIALVLDPGESCGFGVAFSPTVTGGKQASAKINVYVTGADVNTYQAVGAQAPATSTSVHFSGTGDPVRFKVGPGPRTLPLDFGWVPVGTHSIQGVTVTNTSDVNLSFGPGGIAPRNSAFAAVGPSPFDPEVPGDSCWVDLGPDPMVVIGPGGSCPMYYGFYPANTGQKSATATIDAYVSQSEPGSYDDFTGQPSAAKGKLTLKGKGVPS